jgi:hypothetical protein
MIKAMEIQDHSPSQTTHSPSQTAHSPSQIAHSPTSHAAMTKVTEIQAALDAASARLLLLFFTPLI